MISNKREIVSGTIHIHQAEEGAALDHFASAVQHGVEEAMSFGHYRMRTGAVGEKAMRVKVTVEVVDE